MKRTRSAAAALDNTPARKWWAHPFVLFAALLLLALEAYSVSLTGPFLFDDLVYPFASPFAARMPLTQWLTGVRPALMLSFWLNYQSSTATYGYHLTNVVLHALNALLVYAVTRRLLERQIPDSRRVFPASLVSCALFLLHPLQTESVAYIAGRSEVLSATFVLLAWWLCVRRIGLPVTGAQAGAILASFALASAAKEQAVATIPAILLLTDWTFRSGPMWEQIRARKRLYIPLCAGIVAGLAWVATVLLASRSAGANTGISSLGYFFTECRAVLLYLRLFIFPVGQNFDPDFPLSYGVFDHGAILAVAAILAGTLLILRSQPLVRYGWLLFLAFLAPTSSFVPLTDPVAEHRMYLPLAGLCICVSAALAYSRLPSRRLVQICAACSVLAFFATARRSQVWSDEILFWQDVVAKSPEKARPYQHLTHMYVAAGRCKEAISRLDSISNLASRDYFILLNWADAYTCAGDQTRALEKLQAAARLESSADVYGRIGMILIEEGRNAEARHAFSEALAKEAPGTDLAQIYRGNLALLANDRAGAVDAVQRALALNPWCPEAATLLRLIRASENPGQISAGV